MALAQIDLPTRFWRQGQIHRTTTGGLMYFLSGLFIIACLVLGASFCVLLITGTPFRNEREFGSLLTGHKTYTVERFTVGISTSILGTAWLVAWIYILSQPWAPLKVEFEPLSLAILSQIVASVGLLVAGVGIFRKWRRRKGIYLASMVLMISSILISALIYVPVQSPRSDLIYFFGVLTLVIGGFFTAAVYFVDRFNHNFESF